MSLWEKTVAQIEVPSPSIAEAAASRADDLVLGNGNLGKLRDIVVQYAAVVGEVMPTPPKKMMILAAADHGVARHQLSAYPVETTVEMTKNYLISKGAGANALAHYAGADMTVIDAGINADMSGVPGLLDRKIAYGTQDFSEGPAMTRAQAIQAIEAGIEIVAKALTVNRLDKTDGIDVLAKVGGFEFGVISGVILAAAAHHALVIIDGFNTTACAHIAKAIAPASRHYVMASHLSAEKAHCMALEALQTEAYVDLGLRLGEASGASVQMRMLEHALAIYNDCLTKQEMMQGGNADVGSME